MQGALPDSSDKGCNGVVCLPIIGIQHTVKVPPQSPLPTRDGISPSYIWLPEGKWDSALTFLTAHFPEIDANTWRKRMHKNEVRDAHGAVLRPDSPVKRGMCLYYYREIDMEIPIPFQETILFQDENLLVADKPHFLAVTPGGQYLRETLLTRLKRTTGIEHLTPLHRLDRETAGVILFSTKVKSRGAYQALFQTRQMSKTYHAVAPHLPQLAFPYQKISRLVESERFFVMQEVEGQANSETWIDLLERRGANNLYQLQPHTGKRHQLRVHMASLGAPILNDLFYPNAKPVGADDYANPLQLLAKSIAFTDPITHQAREFQSKLSL